MITSKITRGAEIGQSLAAGNHPLAEIELDAVTGGGSLSALPPQSQGAARSSIVNGYAAEFYAGTRIEN